MSQISHNKLLEVCYFDEVHSVLIKLEILNGIYMTFWMLFSFLMQ